MIRGDKRLVFGIILVFILIGFFSYFVLADSISSNAKTYDSNTRTITVSNSGTEIAKIKLDTPIIYNVIRGKDRLVAQFTIQNLVPSSSVFGDMSFYDLKNSAMQINRNFTYKYQIKSYVDVPTYENKCTGKSVNGTDICSYVQSGTTKQEIVNWNVLNDKSL
jgi:hypothetical protein